MAASLSQYGRDTVQGNKDVRYWDITCDSSYPTGGYAITLAQLKLATSLDIFDAEVRAGRTFEYDRTNSKMIVYAAGGAQVANTTDLSTVVVRVKVEGHR